MLRLTVMCLIKKMFRQNLQFFQFYVHYCLQKSGIYPDFNPLKAEQAEIYSIFKQFLVIKGHKDFSDRIAFDIDNWQRVASDRASFRRHLTEIMDHN